MHVCHLILKRHVGRGPCEHSHWTAGRNWGTEEGRDFTKVTDVPTGPTFWNLLWNTTDCWFSFRTSAVLPLLFHYSSNASLHSSFDPVNKSVAIVSSGFFLSRLLSFHCHCIRRDLELLTPKLVLNKPLTCPLFLGRPPPPCLCEFPLPRLLSSSRAIPNLMNSTLPPRATF